MKWMAIACTAENDVLASDDSLPMVESACLNNFRAITRIYGIEEDEANELKNGNLNFRIAFQGPRSTKLVSHNKSEELDILSKILQSRVNLINELYQRISHGFKKFEPVVNWQHEAYEEKYKQALKVIETDQWLLGNFRNSDDIGLVADYADESGLTIIVAASLIINKYHNRKFLVRKLERLRIRHQIAIRNADNKEDFAKCRAAMDEDAFLSMMM